MAPGWELEAVMPELTRRAVQYIKRAADKPCFLYFPLTAPHTPIVPTAPFRGRSGAGDYGDYVCQVDWTVGQIMDVLERTGRAERTLLLFASDNGPENFCYELARTHGHYSMARLRGLKRDTWEGGHRVPFVARWPGVTPSGSTCAQLTILADLMATCAELTGGAVPADAAEDSVSILPLLCGELDQPVRHSAVHHSISGKFAVRQGDWVYIDAPSGDDNREPEWFRQERGYTPHDQPGELYDLRADIGERRNLYAERTERVAQLRQVLAQTRGTAGTAGSAGSGTRLSE
jgi:arylsulfatase A-like enzyme